MTITAQWQNLLQNLGEWHGSFTRLSPEGNVLDQLPTIVTLRELAPESSEKILETPNDRQVRITVNYLTQPDRNLDICFAHVGRDVLFHENGAFSQGSMHVSLFGEFGTELGLREGDRRLRLVQRFYQGNLQFFTLIREALPNSNTPERSPLLATDLVGKWEGKAVVLYADFRSPLTYQTHTTIDCQNDRLWLTETNSNPHHQTLTFAREQNRSNLEQWIPLNGEPEGNPWISEQIFFLPDGAFAYCPRTLPQGQPFVLGVGWQVSPDRRYRLLRHYNDRGAWLGLTCITENRCH